MYSLPGIWEPCATHFVEQLHSQRTYLHNMTHIFKARRFLNPIQHGPFLGLLTDRVILAPLPKIYHTYPTMKKLGIVIPCLKNSKKHINHVIQHLNSADISIFHWYRLHWYKYRYRFHFNTEVLILLTLFESLQVVLINLVAVLMISAKLATLGLLKKQVFRNKGSDTIVYIYDVNNKILLRDSNYIVDVVHVTKV